MSARSSASVSNSLAALREVVVDRRQHLLLHILQRNRDACGRVVGELVLHVLRLARQTCPRRADFELVDKPRSTQLDDDIAARLADRG